MKYVYYDYEYLNNENIVTLSTYTMSNYDDWWKHDTFN